MSGDDDRRRAGCLIALAMIDGFGRARLRSALDVGAELAWRRCLDGCEPDGRRSALADEWRTASRNVNPDELYDRHRRAGVVVTVTGEPGHPSQVPDDPHAAPVLFWRAQALPAAPDVGSRRAVAIVGTRRASRYGIDVATRLGRDLIEAGVDVVSGLALGIDAAAHLGALCAFEVDRGPSGAQGMPIAVVASGVDVVHPQRNRVVWHGVARHGLIVSEYPLGVRPAPWRFPERNRIIVAMSHAVVVVESHERGGSLLTAGFAAAAGVPVLAVPGAVTSPGSLGTNRLLADGCAPCLDSADVLDTLGLHTIARGPDIVSLDLVVPGDVDPVTASVWEAIAWDGSDVGALVRDTGLEFAEVSVALVRLQQRNLVRADGGVFVRQ